MRNIDPNSSSREALEREQTESEQINREPIDARPVERPVGQSEGSGVGVAIGIGLIILGILAIAMPAFATIASTLVFGWLFVVAGVAQIVYAFWGVALVSLFGSWC